jgi:serine/threonine protein kinase
MTTHSTTSLHKKRTFEEMKEAESSSFQLTLGRLLGEGAFGKVYTIRNLTNSDSPSHLVAKISHIGTENFNELQKESLILETLKNSDYFVKFYQSVIWNNRFIIIEERCWGTLKQFLTQKKIIYEREEYPKKFKGLAISIVKILAYSLLKGLSTLNRKRIIHFDIKLDNLLLSREGTLCIGDLGAARMEGTETDLYKVTRWYRAPEIILEQQPYTHAVDMWATGCVIVELITNTPLFPIESASVAFKHFQQVLGTYPDELKPAEIPRELPRKLFSERFSDTPLTPPLGQIIQSSSEDQSDEEITTYNQFTTLVKKMLSYNPEERITPTNALEDPLFTNML